MIAERVWKTKFWNVHQSSFSIPGMRGRGKRKQLRPASFPNDSKAPSETTLPKTPSSTASPQPAQVCWTLMDWVGVCVPEHVCCVCACVYVYMSGRERKSVSECMCERQRGKEREWRGEGQIDRRGKKGVGWGGERKLEREWERQRSTGSSGMSAKMERAWECEQEEWLFPWSG